MISADQFPAPGMVSDTDAERQCADLGREIHTRGDTPFTDESRPRGGFVPAETLVQNGTSGDNGWRSLNQPVLLK